MKLCFATVSLASNTRSFSKTLLDDEAAGMAFPLDAKYFDDFPIIHEHTCSDVAGRQYPRPELAESLLDLCKAKYGEMYLDCKTFPHLHIHGVMEDGTTSVQFHLIPMSR